MGLWSPVVRILLLYYWCNLAGKNCQIRSDANPYCCFFTLWYSLLLDHLRRRLFSYPWNHTYSDWHIHLHHFGRGIIDGITGGNSAVAEAFISDITSPEEKKTIFSTIGGVAGLGMIVGPGIGGFFASGSMGYLGTILFAGCISLGTLLFISTYVQESLPTKNRKPQTGPPWWSTSTSQRGLKPR